MPGYYDWKLRNCANGAIAKADSFLETLTAVEDEVLHDLWQKGGKTFDAKTNAKLEHVRELIDQAEDCLEEAKLDLAKLLPGDPNSAEVAAE